MKMILPLLVAWCGVIFVTVMLALAALIFYGILYCLSMLSVLIYGVVCKIHWGNIESSFCSIVNTQHKKDLNILMVNDQTIQIPTIKYHGDPDNLENMLGPDKVDQWESELRKRIKRAYCE